jgi:hypothetical protein
MRAKQWSRRTGQSRWSRAASGRRRSTRSRQAARRPAGAGRGGDVVHEAEAQALQAGPGDHRAVVAAEVERRGDEGQPGLAGERGERPADRPVGGDPTGGDEGGRPPGDVRETAQGDAGPVDHHVDHRRLEAGAEVGHIALGQRRDPLGLDPQGGLEAGEGEIRRPPPEHRPGEGEALGVAGLRHALDLGSAGIAEPQELGRLVEGLADGVVDGAAEANVVAHPAHRHELGMPAGGEQQQVGEIEPVGQPGGERVRLQMVDREQGLVGHQRQGLGGDEPHQQPADQPRPRRHGDAVEVGEAGLGPFEGPGHQTVQHLHMGAGGDLGHDPAIGGVLGDLAQHLVRADRGHPLGIDRDHRRRGLVAGRLDAEHGLHVVGSPGRPGASLTRIARIRPAPSGDGATEIEKNQSMATITSEAFTTA